MVLQTGDPVKSNLSMRTLGITYEYSFLHSEKFELAATLGINDTDISARARVATQTRHVDQTEDQAGPFPTLGLDVDLRVEQAILSRWPRAILQVQPSTTSTARSAFTNSTRLYRLRPNISFALGYTATQGAPSTRAQAEAHRDFSISSPRARSSSSESRSESRERGRGASPNRIPAQNSTRLLAAAARFHSPAVSDSMRAG